MALAAGKITDDEEYILNLGEQGKKILVNFAGLTDEGFFEAQQSLIHELNAWNKIRHPESR